MPAGEDASAALSGDTSNLGMGLTPQDLAHKDALVLLKKSLTGNLGEGSSGTRSPPQGEGNPLGGEIVNYSEIINRAENH